MYSILPLNWGRIMWMLYTGINSTFPLPDTKGLDSAWVHNHNCYVPLCPSRLWFMERLLGAAKPFSLTSLLCCCTSSLSTFRSPSSPPHAIHPCAACQASVVRHMSFGIAICKIQIHWGKKLEFRLTFEWSEYLVTYTIKVGVNMCYETR